MTVPCPLERAYWSRIGGSQAQPGAHVEVDILDALADDSKQDARSPAALVIGRVTIPLDMLPRTGLVQGWHPIDRIRRPQDEPSTVDNARPGHVWVRVACDSALIRSLMEPISPALQALDPAAPSRELDAEASVIGPSISAELPHSSSGMRSVLTRNLAELAEATAALRRRLGASVKATPLLAEPDEHQEMALQDPQALSASSANDADGDNDDASTYGADSFESEESLARLIASRRLLSQQSDESSAAEVEEDEALLSRVRESLASVDSVVVLRGEDARRARVLRG